MNDEDQDDFHDFRRTWDKKRKKKKKTRERDKEKGYLRGTKRKSSRVMRRRRPNFQVNARFARMSLCLLNLFTLVSTLGGVRLLERWTRRHASVSAGSNVPRNEPTDMEHAKGIITILVS